MKSYGELLIANYLYKNGINYIYEKEYEKKSLTSDFKKYKPDFWLCDYDIYLEHYGIDRNNKTAPYIDSRKYNENIHWKRNLHKENNTICLETFHYQKMEGDLLENLESQLVSHNVPLSPISEESYLEKLNDLGSINLLSNLLSDLLINIKNEFETIDEAVLSANNSTNSKQAIAALELLLPIYDEYNKELKKSNSVDFNDMIHKATSYINDGRYIPKYKYILIDEFQDISSSRAKLIQALRNKVKDCSLFCVGDDWQAIYRFTGSDINFITNFMSYFGDHTLIKLDRTYRFNNSICEISSKFVTKNPSQKRKELDTHDQVDTPAVSVFMAKNSWDINHVKKILYKIDSLASSESNVYILGRYNYLVESHEISKLNRCFPKLKINYYSFHASKGKEADYVIILGLEKGKYGFPSEKVTHPLLDLFLPQFEEYPDAEERRLFYVAITRAKKQVYLVADMENTSAFMSELLQEKTYDLCLDDFNASLEQKNYQNRNCPECKTGTLLVRQNREIGSKFIACSNYPRCNYTENCCPKCDAQTVMKREGRFRACISCGWKIPICPVCSGSMERRNGRYGYFWGCSNYRGDSSPSCTHTEKSIQF